MQVYTTKILIKHYYYYYNSQFNILVNKIWQYK